MSLLADVIDPRTQQPRSRMFWMLLGALVAGQLFALWLLCSHQVRKAEARSNAHTVHQMALTDCLQYIPGSTIASCSQRLNVRAGLQQAGSGAVPVSFVR
jgi:hypothetical protein